MKTMGLFFKKYRIDAGLSQTDVARKLKIKPQFVSNWERGKSNPPLKYYKRLAKMMKVPNDLIQVRWAVANRDRLYEAMK